MQITVKLATWLFAILIVTFGTAYGQQMADKSLAAGVVAVDGSIRLPENFGTD